MLGDTELIHDFQPFMEALEENSSLRFLDLSGETMCTLVFHRGWNRRAGSIVCSFEFLLTEHAFEIDEFQCISNMLKKNSTLMMLDMSGTLVHILLLLDFHRSE